MKCSLCTILIILTMFAAPAFSAQNVRVKDVSTIGGLEDVQIYGYGLVVGLAGTGDRNNTIFTVHTMRNMLKNMGIELPEKQMTLRNVAAVMVTGTVNPFKKTGTRLDVVVSSIGDARSLDGGTLILTPLQGPDGKIYASAQGPIATGGYDLRTKGGMTQMQKNHTLVGRIPDGAIIQQEYRFNSFNGIDLALSLNQPDFTSAVAMAKAIDGYLVGQFGFTKKIASASDASTIKLDFTSAQQQMTGGMELAEFISYVENVTFDVSMPARIVVNERTGTIVSGGNVRISEVAVTHGGIKVEIVNRPEVIQPQPFTFGQSVTVPNPEMVVEEKDMDVLVLNETTTVGDLADALNSLGVSSRDIISIFQAIKEAGALQGQLIIL